MFTTVTALRAVSHRESQSLIGSPVTVSSSTAVSQFVRYIQAREVVKVLDQDKDHQKDHHRRIRQAFLCCIFLPRLYCRGDGDSGKGSMARRRTQRGSAADILHISCSRRTGAPGPSRFAPQHRCCSGGGYHAPHVLSCRCDQPQEGEDGRQ